MPPPLQDQKNRYKSFDDSQLWAMTKLSGIVKQKVIVHDCEMKYTPKHFLGWSMNEWTFMDGMETCENDVSSREMVHVHLLLGPLWVIHVWNRLNTSIRCTVTPLYSRHLSRDNLDRPKCPD